MSPFGSVGRLVARLLGRRARGEVTRRGSVVGGLAGSLPGDRRHPLLVRRAAVHCPHTGQPAAVDLLLGTTGSPQVALRCPMWAEHPPACDQACCKLVEAVTGPALALLVLPAGTDLADEYEIG